MRLLFLAMETEKSLLRAHGGVAENAVQLAETRQQIYQLLTELDRIERVDAYLARRARRSA